jgi:hypothetical protein
MTTLDIDKLHLSEEAARCSHIWEVIFEVLDPDDMELGYTHDELTVAGGADGEHIVAKARAYVLNEEEYGMAVKDFRLKSLRILATADIL